MPEKKMSIKKTVFPLLFSLTLPLLAHAVQLENWRLPFYTMAQRMGAVSGSPSGMFWDDMGRPDPARTFLDASLWPDSVLLTADHWSFEPAASYAAANQQLYTGKNSWFHGSALNEVRFRGFLARQVLDVDSRYADDYWYPWSKARFATGRIGEAFLQYGFGHGFLRFGRLYRNWGPFADRSLVLSNNPYSYDGLELCLFSSFFEFRHFFAAFPGQGEQFDQVTTGANRYLTAHSINFMLGRLGSIGVSEAVVFSRNGGMPDFQYINPLSVYFTTNTNGEGKGNLMLAFQWNLHPFVDNVAIKGQFLIDDIQVDNSGPKDQKPNMLGGDFGVFWTNCFPVSLPHVLSLEYRFVNRWTYTVSDAHTDEGERYTYLGRGLGVPSDDGDSLNVSFAVAGKNFWTACAGLYLARQGENRLWTRWGDSNFPPDAENSLGYRDERQFPSGMVQKVFGIHTEARAYFRNFADVSLSLTNRWIKNKDNVQSDSYSYSPVIAVSLGVHYGNLFLPIPR
jgi:hypothetical protein